MTEIWKPIPDWPYDVSSEGRVRRSITGAKRGTRAGRILKPHLGYRYLTVSLYDGMGRTRMVVHRAVMKAFHGPPGQYLANNGKVVNQVVCHLNGDNTDNRSVNLAWGSIPGNRSAAAHSRSVLRGERAWNAKLTDDAVREIRHSSRSSGELASLYGVSPATVWSARHYESWAHIDAPVRRRVRPTKA